MITPILSPDSKAQIAADVLARLPEWFGLPESTAAYIEGCRTLPFWAALRDDQPLGFIALRPTSAHAAELYVMGVLPEYHRQGVGRQLFAAARAHAVRQGFSFLHVKTVQSGHYEVYDRTNRFYQRLGFLELECLPTLWDEWNPCQVYVLSLKA